MTEPRWELASADGRTAIMVEEAGKRAAFYASAAALETERRREPLAAARAWVAVLERLLDALELEQADAGELEEELEEEGRR